MELHESLYALGQAQGRSLFDDPEGFRGALDDYLDEDAASTGDINLLVDAVRLGAFSSMLTMLDSGADASRAVQEAGTRLARDRGSSDVGGAQWALAVLGYAVGRVGDGQVRQYRAQHDSAAPVSGAAVPPPTAAPPQRPTPAPADPTRIARPITPPAPPQQPGYPAPQSGGHPGQQTSYPGQATGYPGQQTGYPGQQTGYPAPQPGFSGQQAGQPPQSGQAPGQPYGAAGSQPGGYGQPGGWSHGGASSWPPGQPQKKKSKVVPIAIAAVIALIVVAGGIGLAVTLGGGDDGGDDGGGGGDDTTSLEASAIDERYAALGSSVTSGTDSCEEADATSGESEHLTCGFSGGTLDLVTYDSAEQTQSARTRIVTYDIGARSQVSEDDDSAFYSFDPESAGEDASGDPATVYWDSASETVSATLVADDASAKLAPLVNTFEGTSPTVEVPIKPSDGDLTDFGDDFLKLGKCERISNLADGELEENRCAAPNGITVYLAKFDSINDFRSYRSARRQNAVDSGVSDFTKWEFSDSGVSREGALYLYVNTEKQAVIYWDQPDCLCYAEGYQPSGDYDGLYEWWRNA